MATIKEIEDGKVCAILSYFLVGIIWYFADEKMKKNEFAKFHAKQALILLIADLVLMVIAIVPVLGWILSFIGSIILFVLWIMMLIRAINGKETKAPIIGKYADKLTF